MSLFNAYLQLSGVIDGQVKVDEPMFKHTSYRIGGPAGLYVVTNTYKALVRTIEVLDAEGVEWVVLGRGSNVLVSDEGYRGCVIVLGRDFNEVFIDEKNLTLTAGAACPISRLVRLSMSRSLSGLSCLAGIPGSIGGACSMNAGSRDLWIGREVETLIVLRPGEGLHKYQGSDIRWGYRTSSIPTSEIILEVSLRLSKGDKKKIAQEMDEVISKRRATQPIEYASCGSFFKNPDSHSAGALIESVGLKGKGFHGAQISEIHGNFIVNNNNASAQGVIQTMNLAHDAVKEKYGIDLTPEVKFLGFFT